MNNRMRELREAQGWSQGELADRLEVSRQTVNALETGKYDPSLPLAIAIIGGMPERFAPFARIFREAAIAAGHDPAPPMSINSHGYVAETSQRAAAEAWPPLELA